MKYYFIYSAGGGAGDWNGVKRVWNSCMPEELKQNILLKFGDVFLNHAVPTSPCRPQRWSDITNLREWLYEATNDSYVLNKSNILLDSGSAKLVSFIAHNNPDISNSELILEFDKILNQYGILEKYINVIKESNITSAVTFDIPNPFKIRSQNGNARINILTENDSERLIEMSAKYANKIYSMLDKDTRDDVLYTIINGDWSKAEISHFLSLLQYTPINIAIGGLSGAKDNAFSEAISKLEEVGLKYKNIHFLGCGGLKKVKILKESNFYNNATSVDCSTPINRSIDGNVSGTSQSCYYSYQSQELIRINPNSKDRILNLHKTSENPLFSFNEMKEIIEKVLNHQNHNSSTITYDARARLLIHNSHVYKRFAQ